MYKSDITVNTPISIHILLFATYNWYRCWYPNQCTYCPPPRCIRGHWVSDIWTQRLLLAGKAAAESIITEEAKSYLWKGCNSKMKLCTFVATGVLGIWERWLSAPHPGKLPQASGLLINLLGKWYKIYHPEKTQMKASENFYYRYREDIFEGINWQFDTPSPEVSNGDRKSILLLQWNTVMDASHTMCVTMYPCNWRWLYHQTRWFEDPTQTNVYWQILVHSPA